MCGRRAGRGGGRARLSCPPRTYFTVNLKQERKPAIVAKFETRWQPPVAFFERMASRYPFLVFLMRVEHEDDESYPKGYFMVSPVELLVESPTVQAPPPSRQPSDDSEIATRTEQMSL